MVTSNILLFLGGHEWILIVVVVVLLFGGRKIPELMRGLGKGIREFKDGAKEITKESEETDKKEESEKV